MGTSSSNLGSYPQTAANRPFGDMVDELAGWAGSQSRESRKQEARYDIQRSIREFNEVPWAFNRKSDTFALDSAAEGTASFNLETDFRSPVVALLLDSNSKSRDDVQWIDYREWTQIDPDQQSSGSRPIYWTALNTHELGKIIISPPVADSVTWPTLNVIYHRWIVIPANDTSKINVPTDVEEAIFQTALAHFIARVRTFQEASIARGEARRRRQAVEVGHMDWTASGVGVMGNG